jgi:hypothetical protein
MLKAAVLAPMAISTFQSIYYIPHLLKITNSVDKGELTTEQLWHSGSNLVQRHRQYLALDTVKVACLGLAGWRFGKMLEH